MLESDLIAWARDMCERCLSRHLDRKMLPFPWWQALSGALLGHDAGMPGATSILRGCHEAYEGFPQHVREALQKAPTGGKISGSVPDHLPPMTPEEERRATSEAVARLLGQAISDFEEWKAQFGPDVQVTKRGAVVRNALELALWASEAQVNHCLDQAMLAVQMFGAHPITDYFAAAEKEAS